MTFFQGFQNPGDFLNQKNQSDSIAGWAVGREGGKGEREGYYLFY